MTPASCYLLFMTGGRHLAFPLAAVERVLRAARLSPVPDGPKTLLGMLNLGGEIIPVLDLPSEPQVVERKVHVHDRIILLCCSHGRVGLLAEQVQGVVEFSQDQIRKAENILPETGNGLFGFAAMDACSVLIYEPEQLLSLPDHMPVDAPGKKKAAGGYESG